MKLSTLVFWILLLAALAGLAYLGFTSFTDLREIEKEEAELGSVAPDKPTTKQKPTDRLAEAIAAEEKGEWDKAEKLYTALAKGKKSDLTEAKLTALTDIRLAEEAEKQGKAEDALFFYRKALPALADPTVLNKRIERLELTLEYQALYAQGVAAEQAGTWQEAADTLQEARAIARRADISTIDIMKKIRNNRARAAELEKKLDGYYWLFAAFAALDDPYATIAVCQYYSSQDLFLGLRADLETRRANAVRTILKRRMEFPRISVADDEKLVRVHVKNGKTIEGTLVSEDDMGLVVRETRGEKQRNRLIARAAVEKIEKRDPAARRALNSKIAEQLLRTIARKCEKRPAEALALLGRLFHELPTAPILKDTRKQRTVIVTASLKAARTYGDSIPKLLASNIDFFQKICAVCGGTGHPTCPVCHGTGTVYEKCSHCKGTGVSYCGTCGGAGRVALEGMEPGERENATSAGRCPTCRGSGTRTCGRCRGDGGFHTACTKCRQGRRPTCPACRGTGQRPRGKFRPEDIEKLKKALKPE